MKREQRKKAIIQGVTAIAILSVTLLVSAHPGPAGVTIPDEESKTIDAVRVRTAFAEAAPPTRLEVFSGTVRSVENGTVAFTEGGRITEIRPGIGAAVTKGAIIALLDAAGRENAVNDARAGRDAAQEELSLAEREYRRVENLDGGITEAEQDRLRSVVTMRRSQLSRAIAALEEAERRLREARLVAPYDAIVTDIPVDVGQVVSGGQPIAVLSSIGPTLEVEVAVTAATVAGVVVGDAVVVTSTIDPTVAVDATIQSVSPHGSLRSGLYPVTIRIPYDTVASSGASLPLIAGEPVRVSIRPRRQRPAISVPAAAVVGGSDLSPQLYSVQSGRVVPVQLPWVQLERGNAIIPRVVDPGTPVVISGQSRLTPDTAVEVVE